MTTPVPTLQPADARRYLPVLLLLFAGSGCSALIYEIVWYQLLQLVIGSTRDLAGSAAGDVHGRAVPGQPGAAAAAGGTEAASAAGVRQGGVRDRRAAGCRCCSGMPLVDGIYTEAVGHGMPAILLRALVCGLCLLPPTFLMGASLPAAARWLETNPRGRLVDGPAVRRAIPRARCSDACWRASTCCASSTWPRPPSWPRR